jgi:hypothetical protein
MVKTRSFKHLFFTVVHISPDGVTRYPPVDVSDMFYDYAQSKGIDVYASM